MRVLRAIHAVCARARLFAISRAHETRVHIVYASAHNTHHIHAYNKDICVYMFIRLELVSALYYVCVLHTLCVFICVPYNTQ